MIIRYQFTDSGVEIVDKSGAKISLSYPDAASLAEVLIANLPGSHVVGANLPAQIYWPTAAGYCISGEGCNCGGDLTSVKQGCVNWRQPR